MSLLSSSSWIVGRLASRAERNWVLAKAVRNDQGDWRGSGLHGRFCAVRRVFGLFDRLSPARGAF